MRLVFLEHVDEVGAYASVSRGRDDVVVAMNPKVRAALKRRAVAAVSTLPYFDARSHAEGSRWLDAALGGLEARWDVLPASANLRRVIGRSFAYYGRFQLAYLFWAAEIVRRAVEERRPSSILVGSGDDVFLDSPRLEPGERWLGAVVERIAAARGVAVERLRTPGSSRFAPAGRGMGFAERLSARLTLGSLKSEKSGAVLLVASNDYGMGRAVARGAFGTGGPRVQLRGARKPVWEELGLACLNRLLSCFRGALKLNGYYATRSVVSVPLLAAWAEERSGGRTAFEAAVGDVFASFADERRTRWTHGGVSFSDHFEKKFRAGLGPHLAGLRFEEDAMRLIVERVGPRLAVSPFSVDRYDLLGGLCREKRIPGILVSHGSHSPGQDGAAAVELAYHARGLVDSRWPSVAAQSPWTERFCRESGVDSRIVRTGPVLWGLRSGPEGEAARALRRAAGGRRIVVHAGTPKARSAIRFQFYETPDEYVAGISELIETVERLSGVYAVVRFRPSEDLSVRDLKDLLPSSRSAGFSTEGGFLDILPAADLLASFSSTTLEEALQNRVPVLLYGGGGRYRHLPAGAGVFHATGPGDLGGVLERALSRSERRLSDEEHRVHAYGEDARGEAAAVEG